MEKTKIFIVDDMVENLKLMVAIFDEFHPNYTIYQTLDPQNALEIALKVKPDIIITDWEMPCMSGIELIKQFKSKAETKDIPIIMATGVRLASDDLKVALEAGAIDFVTKPIDPKELISRTQSALTIISYHNALLKEKDEAITESSLHLIKGQQFNNAFASKIEELKALILKNPLKAISELSLLKEQLQQEVEVNGWFRFNLSFSKVHTDFKRNIVEAHPTISPAELKLCCFIRLGMANKEIASVLHQGADSVKVARYRVRKKMELDGNVNLESYLSQF